MLAMVQLLHDDRSYPQLFRRYRAFGATRVSRLVLPASTHHPTLKRFMMPITRSMRLPYRIIGRIVFFMTMNFRRLKTNVQGTDCPVELSLSG
jgi:hypothetical protein